MLLFITVLELLARWDDDLFQVEDDSNTFVEADVKNEYGLKVTDIEPPPNVFPVDKFLPAKLKKDMNIFESYPEGFVWHKKNFQGSHVNRDQESNLEIFNVKYSFDSQGRRMTPDAPLRTVRHVLLFGCSFIFGEGLEDRQTLAAQMQRADKETSYYNLAKMSGSVVDAIVTQQMTRAWSDITPKKGGVLFYFSSQMHFQRYLGTMRYIGAVNSSGAFLTEKEGKLVFGGVYNKQKSFRVLLSQILSMSKFLKQIKFDWPPIKEEAHENYARAIAQVRETYIQNSAPNNFFVVFFRPGEKEGRQIIPYLEKYKIFYLDYSNLSLERYATAPLEIQYDGHPTEEYNRILALQLRTDLLNNCIYEGKYGCQNPK